MMGAPAVTQQKRRNRWWDEYDPDPRRSYYLFLRAVYGPLPASEAWEIVNRTLPPTIGAIRNALSDRRDT